MVINGTLDPQFPVSGAQEVLEQVRDIYDAVDGERIRLTVVEADHGYDRSMREAAYGWFRKWLQGEGNSDPVPEPPLVPEPPDSPELKCFPGTPAIRSWPAIRSLARSLSKMLPPGPALPTNESAWRRWVAALRQDLGECLGGGLAIEIARGGPESGRELVDGIERHLLQPEEGIVTPAWVGRPAVAAPAKVVVYLADEGKVGGLGPDFLAALVESGALALAVDPRGIGETTPLPPPVQTVATLDGKLVYRNTEESDTLEFEAATDALMLGRSLFGQQLADLIHAVRYAGQLAPGTPIMVVGSGPICSLLALFAGALDDGVSAIVVDRLLPSYHLLVEEDEQVFPITAYVFGILRTADVPQIATALAPRRLVVTRPIGARLQEMEAAEARDLLRWTISAYRQRGAAEPTVLGLLSAQALAELVMRQEA
jgi:hypothetical protein